MENLLKHTDIFKRQVLYTHNQKKRQYIEQLLIKPAWLGWRSYADTSK